jgi:hypothetical protein
MLRRQVLVGVVSHRDEKRGSCSLSWVQAEDVSAAVADSNDDCLLTGRALRRTDQAYLIAESYT